MSSNDKKTEFPARITISMGVDAGSRVDPVFLSLNYVPEALLTAAEEKLRIAREAMLAEVAEDCGCGFDEPVGEGYTGGICSLHQALANLGGADERS